ncbi:beta-N-acetylhexosaminidase [Chitinophaga sp. MD30]|nr:beta-N-acetylhexosaminidase [Chitinophaga sp. MD30]
MHAMKKVLLALGLLLQLHIGTLYAQDKAVITPLSVIPAPADMKALPGSFTLQQGTLYVAQSKAAANTMSLFRDFLQHNYGIALKDGSADKRLPAINFQESNKLPAEAYKLEVSKDRILLEGDAAGLFYGLQTLQQLLQTGNKGQAKVPAVSISDQPRFAYRGVMLDVSRYFFPVSYIKHHLDMMAQYKFNRLHWHLTDDQGWRIPINKYPRLATVASQRKGTIVGHLGKNNTLDGKPHGGYYTHEEVKDIVQYAAARHITVIPEIEMPGHAQAALTAYPNLGCTGGPYEVSTKWGVHKEVFCAGNDSVFTFLEEVLTEILPLFPSKYIHIGGDECPKDRWKECPKCQQRMKALGLKDEHALQSYFIQRIEKFLNSKGRQIIGWDEILEGGLAPNATVMSWRGEAGGIAAAKEKHDVIMTPNTYLYLDYGQGIPATEPLNIGGYLPLQVVYNYEPYPATLTKEEQPYIKGVQGNLWTEYIPEGNQADYMLYPRALALAEITWSPASKKNYTDFLQRLQAQLAHMDKTGVNFRIPEPAGLDNLVTTAAQATMPLQPMVAGAKMYYTTDGTIPTTASQLYTQPIRLDLTSGQPVVVKCITVTSSGRQSATYSATAIRREYKASVTTTPVNKGLRFAAYFKPVEKAALISGTPDSTGILPTPDIRPFSSRNEYAVVYEGYINIPSDGLYDLGLTSDDGALLYIDDELLIDNDGEHAPSEKKTIVPLRKGFHKVRIPYFNAGGGATLQLSVQLQGKQTINLRNAFMHE